MRRFLAKYRKSAFRNLFFPQGRKKKSLPFRIGWKRKNKKMLDWVLKKFSSSFQQFIPNVRADDGEELVDPQTVLREECQNSECSKLFEILETCNARVRSKKKTAETCDEEMIDFVNCLDHCVSKTLFTKLK